MQNPFSPSRFASLAGRMAEPANSDRYPAIPSSPRQAEELRHRINLFSNNVRPRQPYSRPPDLLSPRFAAPPVQPMQPMSAERYASLEGMLSPRENLAKGILSPRESMAMGMLSPRETIAKGMLSPREGMHQGVRVVNIPKQQQQNQQQQQQQQQQHPQLRQQQQKQDSMVGEGMEVLNAFQAVISSGQFTPRTTSTQFTNANLQCTPRGSSTKVPPLWGCAHETNTNTAEKLPAHQQSSPNSLHKRALSGSRSSDLMSSSSSTIVSSTTNLSIADTKSSSSSTSISMSTTKEGHDGVAQHTPSSIIYTRADHKGDTSSDDLKQQLTPRNTSLFAEQTLGTGVDGHEESLLVYHRELSSNSTIHAALSVEISQKYADYTLVSPSYLSPQKGGDVMFSSTPRRSSLGGVSPSGFEIKANDIRERINALRTKLSEVDAEIACVTNSASSTPAKAPTPLHASVKPAESPTSYSSTHDSYLMQNVAQQQQQEQHVLHQIHYHAHQPCSPGLTHDRSSHMPSSSPAHVQASQHVPHDASIPESSAADYFHYTRIDVPSNPAHHHHAPALEPVNKPSAAPPCSPQSSVHNSCDLGDSDYCPGDSNDDIDLKMFPNGWREYRLSSSGSSDGWSSTCSPPGSKNLSHDDLSSEMCIPTLHLAMSPMKNHDGWSVGITKTVES